VAKVEQFFNLQKHLERIMVKIFFEKTYEKGCFFESYFGI